MHYIGNKFTNDGIVLSKNGVSIVNDTSANLIKYFLSPFKSDISMKFYHESDLKFNLVYMTINDIFKDQTLLHENSIILAKHLYERSDHPNINNGEFYTVYFKNCLVNDTVLDAIGLFKSENKDVFLKISQNEGVFEIDSEKGVNINKLDKGCVIFKTEQEDGYMVKVVDNTNKGFNAQYWTNDFLHVYQKEDDYYNTENIIALCNNFIKNELSAKFQKSKVDQVEILNKSMKYFKENEKFNLEKYTSSVIEEEKLISGFNDFKNAFQQNNDLLIEENFILSKSAVKKQSRLMKNVIRLDKNFDIHIHNSIYNNDLIEQGEDEKGKYYKMYYKKEL